MDVLEIINQLDAMLEQSRFESLKLINAPHSQTDWDRARLAELTHLRNEILTLRSSLLDFVEG